ncbi:DDE-type integrase/transposase/recombinase [Streptomyces sp. NPDC050523]|uniref:DDE-type integrase/transposase/recombinase n=1 Tax=Streptomyces sp. NPDC050523 TaxID=3365622 RepID=UPI003788AE20
MRKYLRRAAVQDGNVLDSPVQGRSDKTVARRFFRKVLKKTGAVPRVVITGRLPLRRRPLRGPDLRRAPAADVPQQPRAGNSHQPTRQRERAGRRILCCPVTFAHTCRERLQCRHRIPSAPPL